MVGQNPHTNTLYAHTLGGKNEPCSTTKNEKGYQVGTNSSHYLHTLFEGQTIFTHTNREGITKVGQNLHTHTISTHSGRGKHTHKPRRDSPAFVGQNPHTHYVHTLWMNHVQTHKPRRDNQGRTKSSHTHTICIHSGREEPSSKTQTEER